MANAAVSNTTPNVQGQELLLADGSPQTVSKAITFDLGGSPPFEVSAGSDVVANLDADLLDGKEGPSGDIVGDTDNQTLTNKSLTAPTMTAGGSWSGDPVFSGNPSFTGSPVLGSDAADTVDIKGTIITAPLKTYSETRTSPAIGGAALTLDVALGTYFKVALNANCTITISNPPAAGRAIGITVIFTADGSVRTITWPGSVVWPGNVAPTMTGTNNKRDIITLVTEDGGTTWFGIIVGQNY